MSKKDFNDKITSTIKVIKHPIFAVHHKSLNKCIKTSLNHHTQFNNSKRTIILKFIKNNSVRKAIKNKRIVQIKHQKQLLLKKNQRLKKFIKL